MTKFAFSWLKEATFCFITNYFTFTYSFKDKKAKPKDKNNTLKDFKQAPFTKMYHLNYDQSQCIA